jgi:energy-coupling factor transporter ATP-binding protein EcfA2
MERLKEDPMAARSRLVKMRIVNLGCVGPEGLTVELDKIVCLVGSNNSGKSTVLRAYELTAKKATLTEKDICKRAGDVPASVEMWVHIPEGTPNIGEKWKTKEGDYLLVRGKWEWPRPGLSRVRTTWDPEAGTWATEGNASGLDEVFMSRLPIPLRIGTLQDPEEEHKALLALVVQPVAERLKSLQKDATSELGKALDALTKSAERPIEEERAKLKGLNEDLSKSHTQVFPTLAVEVDIALGKLEMDLAALLIRNSGVRITEWGDPVTLSQQGTGSQRALFWTLLQVRSRLQALEMERSAREKRIAELQKRIPKLRQEEEGLKQEKAKASRKDEREKLEAELAGLHAPAVPDGAGAPQGVTLPGYMLLIDEPEVALHPAAVRAASRYLYALASDPAWQVMLCTHAPSFIDPLQDHATIVRLVRNKTSPTPSTFRTSDPGFSTDERENLKMLNRFEVGLAEMFFGGFPVLIEGDTEYACFEQVMNDDAGAFPMAARPVLVRARGKGTMRLVIRMLRHFGVPFAVLHDTDTPFLRNGRVNPAWSANAGIGEEIAEARAGGIRVVHRVSIPGFELAHVPVAKDGEGHAEFPKDRDKPWKMLSALKGAEKVRASVRAVLAELVSDKSPEAISEGDVLAVLGKLVQDWGRENSAGDARVFGKPG